MWSVIGALATAVPGMHVTTAVTCPTVRIHPAIIAQAAATSAVLLEGRFALGVGTGEALNEHILGDGWPEADVRLEMLEEAVEVMRGLWEGGQFTHYGPHYAVENARIYTLPDTPPDILVSGFGPKAIELAGRIGDGFCSVAPDKDAVERFRAAGGAGKLVQGGTKVCWGPDEQECVKTVHRLWPNEGLGGRARADPPPARALRAGVRAGDGGDDRRVGAVRARRRAGSSRRSRRSPTRASTSSTSSRSATGRTSSSRCCGRRSCRASRKSGRTPDTVSDLGAGRPEAQPPCVLVVEPAVERHADVAVAVGRELADGVEAGRGHDPRRVREARAPRAPPRTISAPRGQVVDGDRRRRRAAAPPPRSDLVRACARARAPRAPGPSAPRARARPAAAAAAPRAARAAPAARRSRSGPRAPARGPDAAARRRATAS